MQSNLYVIKELKNIEEQLDKLIKNTIFNIKKPIYIFDVHKTTLNKYGELDKNIYCLIKKLITKKYNICFLSFDGQQARILENNIILNKYYVYKSIPKIFMKKRRKELILDYLFKNSKINKKIILIDDNPKNINAVKNLNNKKLVAFQYKNNIEELYTFLKIKKTQKLTKKQTNYNKFLQNQIKTNMSLVKKGKYKSKKQAIAIAYSQTNSKYGTC